MPEYLAPGGFVSGIYARSDAQRGVWQAPANDRAQNEAIELCDAGGRRILTTKNQKPTLMQTLRPNC